MPAVHVFLITFVQGDLGITALGEDGGRAGEGNVRRKWGTGEKRRGKRRKDREGRMGKEGEGPGGPGMRTHTSSSLRTAGVLKTLPPPSEPLGTLLCQDASCE